MTSLTAVLWDMDGTLVDSEPLWVDAETELVASFGRTWTVEDGMALVGKDMFTSATILQSRGVDLPVMEIKRWLSDSVAMRIRERPTWRPGARELLEELAENRVPMALVTSSPRTVADAVMALVDGSPFTASIALEDVREPKPNPEPYLSAAALLGAEISKCVALEDSPSGLRAAVASGAVTVAVPHVVGLPEDAGATIWPTLAGRRLSDLTDLVVASHVHAQPASALSSGA